ncbi:MAG: DUF2612 domain-containing protein [Alphaproteobacteria bacterium]|nr:DUF2612 domain-containing protein [Alphaproteobacteria bacterium]
MISTGNPDLDQWLGRVTSTYNQQPRFMATVDVSVQPMADALEPLRAFARLWDIEVARGAQLDMIGQWVGLSRRITLRAPETGWFSLDIPGLGLDQARWYGPDAERGGHITLDDEEYRLLLKARILANHWDGTRDGAYAVWNGYFGPKGFEIFVFNNYTRPYCWFTWDDPNPACGWEAGYWDGTDPAELYPATGTMHMLVILYGEHHSQLVQALLTGGYLDLKPAGVALGYWRNDENYWPGPMFGWDLGPTEAEWNSGTAVLPHPPFAGWDIGHWMQQIEPVRLAAGAFTTQG